MKHRLSVPWADDEDRRMKFDRELTDFIHRCPGWQLTSMTWDSPRRTMRPMIFIQISPDFGLVSGITAFSGLTLVYDEAEESLGLTRLAEPQDARPAVVKPKPEPKDEMPAFSFGVEDIAIKIVAIRGNDRLVRVTHRETGLFAQNWDQAEAFRELRKKLWEYERQTADFIEQAHQAGILTENEVRGRLTVKEQAFSDVILNMTAQLRETAVWAGIDDPDMLSGKLRRSIRNIRLGGRGRPIDWASEPEDERP